jgi:hypothetical protein
LEVGVNSRSALLAFGFGALGIATIYWWWGSGPAVDPAEAGLLEIYETDLEKRDGQTTVVDLEPPLVLRIPEAFRSRASRGRARARDSVNLITFYPSFTSQSAPANAPYRIGSGCTGYCNGQIMVSLKYQPYRLSWQKYATYADQQNPNGMYGQQNRNVNLDLRDFSKPASSQQRGAYKVKAEHVHGFNTALYIFRTGELDSIASVEEFDRMLWKSLSPKFVVLRHLAPNKRETDLHADCEPEASYPNCSLFFSLKCNPAVGIEVNVWPWSRIEEAFDVQRAVDRYVSGMIVKPKCEIQSVLR